MKTIRLLLTLPLFLGFVVVLFQGCYTQLATTQDQELSYQQEDTSYQQEEQPAHDQSYDSNFYNDYDNWHSRSYIGFSYYYPSWRTSWGWDGCIYPSYWDPWYSPSYYPAYGYYGYNPYWYSYPAYGYYSNHHGYNRHQYATRNSGYQRGGNLHRNGGTVRSSTSGTTETGSIYNTRGVSIRGSAIPNATSTGTRQNGTSTTTVRSSRSGVVTPGHSSGRVSTGRSSRGNGQSSVRQQRTQNRSTPRIGRSQGATVQRGSSSRNSEGSSGQPSRSSTPPPQRTSPPPSAPAPRNDGGEQHSSGSGRSRR